MKRVALAALVTFAPALLPAQSSPLVGRWNMSMTVGSRLINDEETQIVQTGKMTVIQQGDSLIATLEMQPPEGMPARPASRMATKAAPGPITFVHHGTAMISSNGEQKTSPSVSTFKFTVSGNALTGTVERRIEGMDISAAPQPVTGTRITG